MKAIFLGKFQPPHLGHVQTILKINKRYKQVIVGITNGAQKIHECEKVKEIFEDLFEIYPGIVVEIIDGTIEDESASLDKYNFDIVVSGNNKVLNTLNKKGYKTVFHARTEGIGYSGSELRSLSHNKNTVLFESKINNYEFKMMPISEVKPLEKILPIHFRNIEKIILEEGVIKRPLIIDSKYNIVLDGSHRYAFLLKHGFKYAPCVLVDYDDESIFVGNQLKHRFLKDDNFVISKSEVIFRGLNENLFDARTTRHFFPFRKKNNETLLINIEQGDLKDISYLLENTTIEEEINIDNNYIFELDEELETLKLYIEEQEEVRGYLQKQISLMVNKKREHDRFD